MIRGLLTDSCPAPVGILAISCDALQPTVKVDLVVVRKPLTGIRGRDQHMDVVLVFRSAPRKVVIATLDAGEDAILVDVLGFLLLVTGDEEGEF